MALPTGILFQNAEETATILDVPGSIVYAQGAAAYASENVLLSTAPPTTPFPITNEPQKGASTQGTIFDDDYHKQIREAIRTAIAEMALFTILEWFLQRKWVPRTKNHSFNKRKRIEDERALSKESAGDLSGMEEPLFNSVYTLRFMNNDEEGNPARSKEPHFLTESSTQPDDMSDMYNRVYYNAQDEMACLSILQPQSQRSQTFYIPAYSTFLLSRIQDSVSTFKSAASRLLSSTTPSAESGQFDFILLDPPWPNASAKRAKTYQRLRTVHHTEELLSSIRLQEHIAPEGYVGVWITNKQKIRDMLLRPNAPQPPPGDTDQTDINQTTIGGLFHRWGLELVEEWIWIKTTAKGEPITDLDSSWRKPYEIMLLGRRVPDAVPTPQMLDERHSVSVKRRIIAAVPDLHSRKPSLKELIEPLMPDRNCYRALEIFARHLTAGWWAWGDEVLKFNWERAWTRKVDMVEVDDDGVERA